MILEKQKEAIVHQEGETQESIKMSLDLESAQVLMQMLSKNLYSDAIGSTIRECASNALDSHRRAGTDKPIIVSVGTNKENNYEFSVEDFGTGLDDEDVKNIISKYGKSTKRNSATELGMMGLGFKAPLAYSSSFYFVCRKDGMERKYMMYEGEDVNTIDLLYETPTDQPNGVKVIVPIKYGNRYIFEKKIKQQLAYFENVYFDVSGISNNFAITRHPLFQFSKLATDSDLHICLDDVYYPIDFEKLGIETLSIPTIPIALRFSLTDGIFPTPNRESIRYTQEAKAIILDKLTQVANYFVEKYNETIEKTTNLKNVIDYFNNPTRYLKMGDNVWDIRFLSNFATTKIASPKVEGIELLSVERLVKLQDRILGEYENKFYVNKKTIKAAKRHFKSISIKNLRDIIYIYHENKIPLIKRDYIKSIQPDGYKDAVIVKKIKNFPLRNKKLENSDDYYTMLNLGAYPKDQWRKLINEFKTVIKNYTDSFINIDKLEVPQKFIDSRKKQPISTSRIKGADVATGNRRVKLKGEMICKQATGLDRWVDGKNCKWVSKTYDMTKFHQNKFILVYGKQEDMKKMDEWFKLTREMNVELAVLNEREFKLVEKVELHNLMSFSKFMEGKNKPFQRIVTACLIDNLYNKQMNIFKNVYHLNYISKDMFDKINNLKEYRSKNFRKGCYEFINTIIDHATKINAFDPTIYSTYVQVNTICEKLPFLDLMLFNINNTYVHNANLVKLTLLDLFKYYKHRMNWKNYKICFKPSFKEDANNGNC